VDRSFVDHVLECMLVGVACKRLHYRLMRLGEVHRLEDRRDHLEEGNLDLGVDLLEEDSHLVVDLEGVRPVQA
jgi:hypothetical protein